MTFPMTSYNLGEDEFRGSQFYRCPDGPVWETIPGLPGFLQKDDGTRLSVSLVMLGGTYKVRDQEDKNVVFPINYNTPCWISTDLEGVATQVIPLKWEIDPPRD